MSSKYRTAIVNVRDRQGQHQVLVKRTEVLVVRFANGSTGAQSGDTDYLWNGREVREIAHDLFESEDGVLLKRVD